MLLSSQIRFGSVVRPGQVAQVPVDQLASHLGLGNVNQILRYTVSHESHTESLAIAQEKLDDEGVVHREKRGGYVHPA